MKVSFDELDESKIEEVIKSIDENAEKINSIVQSIIKPYCDDLDNYVDFIRDILKDTQNPPTAQELDDFCMNLSVFIYYASSMQEQLGIKDDIAKSVYKDIYHTARFSQEKGTVADKDTIAELASQQEYITSICYKRAYSIVKAKVASAQELLSSCKKIISRRMAEYETTHFGM